GLARRWRAKHRSTRNDDCPHGSVFRRFIPSAMYIARRTTRARPTPGRAGREVVETGAVARIVSQRLVKMRAILFRLQQRQERSERIAHISDEAEIEAGATPEIFGPEVHLGDDRLFGIELLVGEIRAQHEE